MSIPRLSGPRATDQIQTATAGGALADSGHGAAQSRAAPPGQRCQTADHLDTERRNCPLRALTQLTNQTSSNSAGMQQSATRQVGNPYLTTVGGQTNGSAGAIEAMADAECACEVLCQMIPEFRAGAGRLLSSHVKGGSRKLGGHIVVCRISYRNGKGPRATTATIVAKSHRGDHGARALETLQQLWEAGFRPPARYRVPRPFGYWPEQRTLFQALAPGTLWVDFLHRDPGALGEASARAADWLLQLQRTSLKAELKDPETDIASLRRRVEALASSFPRYAPRLEALAARMLPRLRPDGAPLVPSHGDYHPKNVLIAPKCTSVIDVHSFGLREAAFDVGYAVGELLIMSYLWTGDFAAGVRAAGVFWRRYETSGQATWPRVAVHVASTFVQSLHYELCVLVEDRDSRLQLLDLWPDLSERWLESDGPATLEDLVRNR